ncbi:hypothetical protein ACQPX6_17470 [Actinomycetospora sp. CA-101289]|uniref:hypothetical protein n=1 Tax=Actinomycetospora sp. CA-101289 TaxID=3239893 RepID=UPI003D98AF9D
MTGAGDGRLRLFDASAGGSCREPLEAHQRAILALSGSTVDGTNMIASVGADDRLVVTEPRRRLEFASRVVRGFRAMASGRLGSRWVAVTAEPDGDGPLVRGWDLVERS